MRGAATVVGCIAAAVVAASCTAGEPATAPSSERASSSDPVEATPTEGVGSAGDVTGGTELGEVTASTRGWATSVGLPVVGAVRTSTGLSRLGGVAVDERLAVCRSVAAELDTIAPPEVLSALAVTADAETATLLVGDLRAKADLLAVCDQEGPAVDLLVKEVAATHEVAVAWLTAIGDG